MTELIRLTVRITNTLVKDYLNHVQDLITRIEIILTMLKAT